ncbi:MAG TPA: tripartite tricarboxylate transporter substrate binding protein [Bosea sp. (in: a-proteobacteria)]|jgi:tripartite-type tricarboxylate transporter receptor subunit TctC|uniref:Bug family tripartite tricarboxylate transporter substrate binding protein n=1 Tax=Bosea sp. (in: a-proteobacteria) TaxID=1871050 RepID=UPI002E0F5A4F|nr:tripartite tricarboxylate transporter substrate binding protein [Bosea sp. (in: a-proteobacteria)]
MNSKRLLGRIFGALSLFAALPIAAGAQAQSFPSGNITIIAPYSAGSPADTLARRLAEGMAKSLNATVLVENVVGAGGIIGTLRAQKAAPDGHTLVIGTQGTLMMNKFIYKNLRYRPDQDFDPIVNLVEFPNLVVAPASLNVKTLKEFVSLAKERAAAGKPLTYGSGGVGSSAHLAAELLKMRAGIELTHVPYKSVADTLSDLLTGRIDLIFGNVGVFGPHVEKGSLVGLAVTAPERSKALPEVPSIVEAGYPDAEFSVWLGLFAPAKTPTDILEKLKSAAVASMAVPATRTSFATEGAEVKASASGSFRDFIAKDAAKWRPIISKLGIEIEN